MSNDMSLTGLIQQALHECREKALQHEGKPLEMLPYEQKMALLCEHPDSVFSFSLDDLRTKWPDPKERAKVIVMRLTAEIIDCFWPDRQEAGLLMLQELIEIVGNDSNKEGNYRIS